MLISSMQSVNEYNGRKKSNNRFLPTIIDTLIYKCLHMTLFETKIKKVNITLSHSETI